VGEQHFTHFRRGPRHDLQPVRVFTDCRRERYLSEENPGVKWVLIFAEETTNGFGMKEEWMRWRESFPLLSCQTIDFHLVVIGVKQPGTQRTPPLFAVK